MDNPDSSHAPSARHSDDCNATTAQDSGKSRLEKVLGKGTLWKKKALRNITRTEERERETDKLAYRLARLSIQLDERDDEIERLRQTISKLQIEKSNQDRAYQQEVEMQRAELERLQVAYDQFEKESDGLLAELGEQNERLLSECRSRNSRSLLEP